VTLESNVEEMLGAAIVAALNEPKPSPKSLPQFSAPVLAMQYTSLYRTLIASAVSSKNATVAASINPSASERQPL
jgi:hypothetical protein